MIIVKLLTKKRQLVSRLEKADLGADERAEHEAALAKIDNALDLLQSAITKHKQQSESKVREKSNNMAEDKATARRARQTGEQNPRSSTVSDPQRALAHVRWRRKVRRNA